MSSTSALSAVSRLPVGSSASTSDGFVTIARATATRCCWPPESSVGRWSSLSPRPTRCERRQRAVPALLRPDTRIRERELHVRQSADMRGSRLKLWKTKPILRFLMRDRSSSSRCRTFTPSSQ